MRKHMNSLTDFFDSNIGLFQGEITSPILFSLFLNDIENYFQLNLLEGIWLGEVLVYLLMFADDAVLLSETAEGLQKMLLKLESYCSKWNLTVNTVKTKIMIFQKGGQLKQTYYWTYNNEEIEVVKSFVYLGVLFSSGGSFQQATSTLVGKALRAMRSLFNLTKDYDLPIHISCNLFDSYVGSILNYNCEVWGFNQAENIERVHRKFCKRLLNVKTNTNSLANLSELGRYPLIINRKIRIIKYWLKLHTQKSNNCILTAVIKQQKSEIIKDRHIKNWCNKVKNLLESTGFSIYGFIQSFLT